MSERSLSDWLTEAGNTLEDRGLEYGDPRHNLLRIYKIARVLGVQLREPTDLAIIYLASGKSRARGFVLRSHRVLNYLGFLPIFYSRRLG